MIYENTEILNKGCQVSFAGDLYYCYNTTSLMHFVRCGKKGQILKPNASNTMNLTQKQVLNLINNKVASIEVGSLNN